MNRHPLHIQNGNDPSSIVLARLLLAIDAVDINAVWEDGKTVGLGMEQWSGIVEARKSAARFAKGHDLEAVERLATHIDSVDLRQCYDAKRQRVIVPLETWANLLTDRNDMRGPQVAKAYATEFYIRHGRFPGR